MTNFFMNKIQSKINNRHRLKLNFSAPKYAAFKGVSSCSTCLLILWMFLLAMF